MNQSLKMKMRVLVTGGSGFIGTNLVHQLASDYEVLNLDVRAPRDSRHLNNWRKCDILLKDELALVVKQFAADYVIHLAARTDLDGKTKADYNVNTIGTANLLEALKEYRILEELYLPHLCWSV